MQNFKQYLTEANIDFAPWQHPDSEEYKKVEDHQICALVMDKIRRNKNGTVSTSSENYKAKLVRIGNDYVLPVKYSSAKDFSISILSNGPGITSLWGFPDKVKDTLTIKSSMLETMDHLNTTAFDVFIQTPKLKEMGNSAINCYKLMLNDIGQVPLKEFVKHVKVDSFIDCHSRVLYKKPILSIFKIAGTWKEIRCGGRWISQGVEYDNPKELSQVMAIVNKHLKNRDMLECQEELIDAGLKEYARL